MTLAALNLMGLRPQPALSSSAGSAPQPPAAAREPLVLDARRFVRQGDNQAADSTATQSAYFARLDGVDYRLKLNPPDRLTNTFHEVLSARLLNDVGLKFNPASAWVVDGGALWVASKVIPGARDVGPFLLEAARAQVKSAGGASTPALAKHLDRYGELERQAAAQAGSEAIAPLLQKHRKGGFDQLGAADHQALQPLRDTHRQMLQQQQALLDLLPQGPALRSNLLMAAYAGEVVAEWDFLNHARFNTMVHDDGAGGPRVQTVDRGISGLVGFGGQLKSDNARAANQPARIDDPYAMKASDTPGSHYVMDHFSHSDLAFEHTSPSFGLIGGIPRSASSAFIFRDVIRAEREHLDVGSPAGRPARVAPAGVPDEALQVAWLLKHKAGPDPVSASIRAACDDCRSHPATQALLGQSVMGARDETDLARRYSDRIAGIVQRAEQGGALARWADTHPVQARQMLAAGELTGAL